MKPDFRVRAEEIAYGTQHSPAILPPSCEPYARTTKKCVFFKLTCTFYIYSMNVLQLASEQ